MCFGLKYSSQLNSPGGLKRRKYSQEGELPQHRMPMWQSITLQGWLKRRYRGRKQRMRTRVDGRYGRATHHERDVSSPLLLPAWQHSANRKMKGKLAHSQCTLFHLFSLQCFHSFHFHNSLGLASRQTDVQPSIPSSSLGLASRQMSSHLSLAVSQMNF